jgi:hypothetical protein
VSILSGVFEPEHLTDPQRLRHISAGTALTFSDQRAALGPIPQLGAQASVSFSASSVTVPSKDSAVITASFTPPIGLDPATYPVYSGWITVVSDKDSLKIPYIGTTGVLGDKETIDPSTDLFGFTTPAIINYGTSLPQVGPANYTLRGTDIPVLLIR